MDEAVIFSAGDAKGYCAGIVFLFCKDSCGCGLFFLEGVARRKGFDFQTLPGPAGLLPLVSHIIHFRNWSDAICFAQLAEESLAKDFHDTNAYARVLLGDRNQKYDLQKLSTESIRALAEKDTLNNLAIAQGMPLVKSESRI